MIYSDAVRLVELILTPTLEKCITIGADVDGNKIINVADFVLLKALIVWISLVGIAKRLGAYLVFIFSLYLFSLSRVGRDEEEETEGFFKISIGLINTCMICASIGAF